MAHDYSMELGFDFDSEQKDPSYDGFLEAACAEGSSFKSMDELKKDGGLSFAIYDVSDSPHAGTGTPQKLTVTFSKADDASPASSPFAATALEFTTFHNRGTKGSPQFGNRQSWYAQAAGHGNDSNPTVTPFVNTGNFFVSFALTVAFIPPGNPSSPVIKTFGQDPRMDVDT